MDIFLKEYDYSASKQWCIDHEGFLLKAVGFYLVSIFGIKYFMKDRKPFGLEQPLIIWNVILSTFSLLGFLFITPTLFNVIRKNDLHVYTYTHITELQTGKVAGYWTFLWVVSKIPEFVDTFFIVLRKKPLMFMHWYHHALTGYYAFVNFSEDNAHMIWIVWANYLIHFCMYGYYMLRALHFRIPPQVAQTITLAQMVQFLISLASMAHLTVLHYTTTQHLAFTFRGIAIASFMLSTYFVLWLRFYNISYLQAGGKKYVQHQEKVNEIKKQ
uniref:Elongation of very long chain fatty acids protein n=1 Tax=Panagrolaimus superbus TaxID=310955 RepID=A0A914Y1A1_9BILA